MYGQWRSRAETPFILDDPLFSTGGVRPWQDAGDVRLSHVSERGASA
ncbi:hypothetical protein [Oceaniglobus trochenteri]|nr:hypothetical protein [Oceaniglobus trochenteri]